MESVFAPTRPSHSRTRFAVNSLTRVAADVLRDAPTHEEVAESLEYVLGREPPSDADGETLPGVLVHDRQHPEGTPFRCAVHHSAKAPDVVSILWPQPDARPVVEPQPPSLRLAHSKAAAPLLPRGQLCSVTPIFLTATGADLTLDSSGSASRSLRMI